MSICGKSELCIFDNAAPQAVVQQPGTGFIDIHPIAGVDASVSKIEFFLDSGGETYLDLNDTLLYVKLKVTADGENLAPNANVTAANYFLNALFSDVTLQLNGVTVEGGNSLYPYKAVIETDLNYDKTTKSTQFTAAGYDADDARRKAFIAQSKVVELVGALRLDFFDQPKYLLPGVSLRVTLNRSKDDFALVVGGALKPNIQIQDAILYVRQVSVAPAVRLGHEIGLLKKNAVYPYHRKRMVTYTIPKGCHSYSKDSLFSGSLLPKFVVVCFVRSDAFNGDYKENPFYFGHFDVGSVQLFRNGESVPYRGGAYEPNFGAGLYARDYLMAVHQNTELMNKNFNNGITMKDFATGHSYFIFNLTPDFDLAQSQLSQSGNLRLDVKFRKALANSINVLLYGIFDAELQITKDKQVLLDYQRG